MKKVHQAIGCKPSIALAILRTGVGFGWRPYCCTFPLTVAVWALVFAKSKQHGTRSTYFIVEVQDGNIVVSLPNGRFIAKYYKRAGRPHLILRERTKTADHELLTDAFQAAVNKAPKLGWIA